MFEFGWEMSSENLVFLLVLDFVGHDLSGFRAGYASFSAFLVVCTSCLSPRPPTIISLPRVMSKEVNAVYLGTRVLMGIACLFLDFRFVPRVAMLRKGVVWRVPCRSGVSENSLLFA